ncbi:MAG: hypothetical protein P8186_31150, partial [Anaerolineae bacterium]
MLNNRILKALTLAAILMLLVAGIVSCAPSGQEPAPAAATPVPEAPTEAAPTEEAPTEAAMTEEAPTEAAPTEETTPAEETSIVIVIPEDPPSFNGAVT